MKKLFVLENYIPDNHLIGIFTTVEKAKCAAIAHMEYFCSDKIIKTEESNGEILFSVFGYSIHITEWEIDKALDNKGSWKTL